MRILVTGGAGFIGSHLAKALIERGDQVVVFDNESTGRRRNVPDQAEYVVGDVARVDDLDGAFSEGLDAVFHVSGQVSLIQAFADPLRDLRTNVEGTVNVLQLCLKHRVPRLLYASSMTVYGHTETLPTTEDARCVPLSYYGVTKYAAERYVHTTAERDDLAFDFRVTSFRMYNVYGPRQALDNPYQGVLGIFLGNVIRGEPLTIFGDGGQSRDFIYVSDVVDGWLTAVDRPESYGRVFNLGSGRRLSIVELARQVAAAADHRVDVAFAPARPGEQRHVEADTTAAREAFGWEARVPFAAGLAETIAWAGAEDLAAPNGVDPKI